MLLALKSVPYQETAYTIWEESKLPALKENPRVTRVICVDFRDNRQTEVVFERPVDSNQDSSSENEVK